MILKPASLELKFVLSYGTELVGLSLSYGLALNGCLYGVVYLACQLENKMVSVERINQYCGIPSEAPPVIENNRPAENWPTHGSIQFQRLQVFCCNLNQFFSFVNLPCAQWKCPPQHCGLRSYHEIRGPCGVTLFIRNLYLSDIWQRLVVENGYENGMCYDEIGLCAQNMVTIVLFNS